MRKNRFNDWITSLVDANLPAGVKRIDWAETGITKDKEIGEHTTGLVLQSPAGGTAYLAWVIGHYGMGENSDDEEEIVEGAPPERVDPVELTPTSDGRIRCLDLEAWLAALVVNSQSPEIKQVERSSALREQRPASTQPFGITIWWHSANRTYTVPTYTLAPGEKRGEGTKYRIKEAF